MIKSYWKQTWALLWQNKLFGGLYLIGTALPVTMTMIVVMYFHLLTAPVYPELNRDRLYEVRAVKTYNVDGVLIGGGYCSEAMVHQWFYPLRSAGKVTAIYTYNRNLNDWLQLADGKSELKVHTKYTDPNFFRVFDFDFVAGAPFSWSDLESARPCGVLSASMARRLFGTEQAVGKRFTMNYIDYTVTGVVRDASSLTPTSFAQIWLPYTHVPGYGNYQEIGSGGFTTVFRVQDEKQARQLQADVRDLVRRYNVLHADEKRLEVDCPMPVWKRNLVPGNMEVDLPAMIRFWGGLLLAFLIVPAVNLGGMISGRMDTRLPELGISRAFGAGRGYLLRRVVRENLLMTLAGGLLGLVLSWMLLGWGHDWIIGLFDTYGLMQVENEEMLVTPAMLFSPVLFLAAFLFCLLLNLASALIPAWRALRVPIVRALYEKK